MLMDYTKYDSVGGTNPLGPVGMTFFVLLLVAIYIYSAYCLYIIAQKTNTPYAWMAWVPILNLALIIMIAGKSLWWLLALLVPFVNLIVAIWLWAKVAEVRNRPWWWGILMLINPVNLVLLWFMAFREPKNKMPAPSTPEVVA